jgi:hypothetical protein
MGEWFSGIGVGEDDQFYPLMPLRGTGATSWYRSPPIFTNLLSNFASPVFDVKGKKN